MSAAASSGGGGGGGGSSAGDGGAGSARLHARSFKLRFATQHEPGRSDVSAVKPRGLPSVVRGACDARCGGASAVDAASEASALQRVRALFRDGPREKHPAPLTASHEYDTVTDHTRYGWWWRRGAAREAAARRDPRLRHHIRDSAWLKERLRVLAADDGLQRR